MVFRREYGATGSASHSGHSESFVIAACAAPGAIAAATALAPAAALRERAARRLLEPWLHCGTACLAELVSLSSADRTQVGASLGGAESSTSADGPASSASTETMVELSLAGRARWVSRASERESSREGHPANRRSKHLSVRLLVRDRDGLSACWCLRPAACGSRPCSWRTLTAAKKIQMAF